MLVELKWMWQQWMYVLYYKWEVVYVWYSEDILDAVLWCRWMVFDSYKYVVAEYDKIRLKMKDFIKKHEPQYNVNKWNRKSDLEDFIKSWNSHKEFKVDWRKVKWLQRCNKITEDVEKAFKKAWKSYWYDGIIEWTQNYINNILERTRDNRFADWWYINHRFSLYKFLSQANWVKTFINE